MENHSKKMKKHQGEIISNWPTVVGRQLLDAPDRKTRNEDQLAHRFMEGGVRLKERDSSS